MEQNRMMNLSSSQELLHLKPKAFRPSWLLPVKSIQFDLPGIFFWQQCTISLLIPIIQIAVIHRRPTLFFRVFIPPQEFFRYQPVILSSRSPYFLSELALSALTKLSVKAI
jgi:hypothetical protein